MKIKKIVDLCKKRGTFYLYIGREEDSVQWLSDGAGMYPLFGVPELCEETLYRIFDIPEKQQEKIMFRTERDAPKGFCLEDCEEGEVRCEKGIELYAMGVRLVPFKTSTGIRFMDAKYLEPMADVKDYLEVFERTSRSGSFSYFAIKSGMTLMGVVMPFQTISEDFVKDLKELSEQCEVALFNAKSQTSALEEEPEDE